MTTAHLNLKWSVGDLDRLKARAKQGGTAQEIADEFEGSDLESTAHEIHRLCLSMGVSVRLGCVFHASPRACRS